MWVVVFELFSRFAGSVKLVKPEPSLSFEKGGESERGPLCVVSHYGLRHLPGGTLVALPVEVEVAKCDAFSPIQQHISFRHKNIATATESNQWATA